VDVGVGGWTAPFAARFRILDAVALRSRLADDFGEGHPLPGVEEIEPSATPADRTAGVLLAGLLGQSLALGHIGTITTLRGHESPPNSPGWRK